QSNTAPSSLMHQSDSLAHHHLNHPRHLSKEMTHPMSFVHPQHPPTTHNALPPPLQSRAALATTAPAPGPPQPRSLPPQPSQLPPSHHSSAPWSPQRPMPMQFTDAAALDYRHYPYPAPAQQPPAPHHFSHMNTAAPYMYSHAEPHTDMFSSHYHQQLLQMPRRVRCTQACNHCHRRKARCVRNTMPDGSLRCDNCIREGIVCVWRESRRRGPKRKRLSQEDMLAPEQPIAESPVELPSNNNTSTHGNNAASIANLLNTTGAAVTVDDDRTSADRDSNSSTPVNGSDTATAAGIDDQATDA
ncbi:hypothetical protein H4R20_006561, partial [Coemansia guatemalensis]